ncbi:MAG: PAS domain-containing protein, partial [Chloroflexi bacterium]|nr:PAS domain-containing protein [Chloroflexota bacterium]
EALGRQERLFRAIVEDTSEAIVITGEDATIRYQSPSYSRVLGRAPEGGGWSVFRHMHPDDVPTASSDLALLLQEPGLIMHREARARHADGSWRTLEITARNLLQNPDVRGIRAAAAHI